MAAEGEEQSSPALKEDKPLPSGLMCLIKPSIEALDNKVNDVRKSQVALREQIDKLSEDLVKLGDAQDLPIDLEPYVKKLISSRRRITLVNSILQNAQERLSKLNQHITQETEKKKADLVPSLNL